MKVASISANVRRGSGGEGRAAGGDGSGFGAGGGGAAGEIAGESAGGDAVGRAEFLGAKAATKSPNGLMGDVSTLWFADSAMTGVVVFCRCLASTVAAGAFSAT